IHGGPVLVDRGLRGKLLHGQLGHALVLQLGVEGRGLGCGEIGLGLVDLRLIGRLLDLVEQVVGPDVLALAEQPFVEEALDAGAQLNHVDRLDAPDEGIGPGHAADFRHAHPDSRRWSRGRLRLLLPPAASEQRQQHGRHGQSAQRRRAAKVPSSPHRAPPNNMTVAAILGDARDNSARVCEYLAKRSLRVMVYMLQEPKNFARYGDPSSTVVKGGTGGNDRRQRSDLGGGCAVRYGARGLALRAWTSG